MKGKYEYFQGEDDRWYWNLKAANHKIILSSSNELMHEPDTDASIYMAQTDPFVRDKLQILTAEDGRFYFNISDEYGIIGTSQMYKSKRGCRKGHASVMVNRSTDKVVKI